MKDPIEADYKAGQILHSAWYNALRVIAPPFELIDKFDRLRWIKTAKVNNAAQQTLPVQEPVAQAEPDDNALRLEFATIPSSADSDMRRHDNGKFTYGVEADYQNWRQKRRGLTPLPVQEPVGSVRWGGDEVVWTGEPPESGALLYTTPPLRPWVDLTEEEILACDPSEECWGLIEIARTLEAKLREKNST